MLEDMRVLRLTGDRTLGRSDDGSISMPVEGLIEGRSQDRDDAFHPMTRMLLRPTAWETAAFAFLGTDL